ncbi:MAG: HEAT repeat domain-containing protein [bacterium]
MDIQSGLFKLGALVLKLLSQELGKKALSSALKRPLEQRAFEKAIDETVATLHKYGYSFDSRGGFYEEFLTSEEVIRELWSGLFDPSGVFWVNRTRMIEILRTKWESDIPLNHSLEDFLFAFIIELQYRISQSPRLEYLARLRVQRMQAGVISLQSMRVLLDRCREEIRSRASVALNNLLMEMPFIEPRFALFRDHFTQTTTTRLSEHTGQFGDLCLDSLQELVKSKRNFLFIADSGFGKSIVLRQLELLISSESEAGARVPIFSHISDVLRYDTPNALIRFLTARFSTQAVDTWIIETALEKLWHEGRLVFLLDSLDQIDNYAPAIDRITSADVFSTNQIMIGTRPSGYRRISDAISDFVPVSVLRFSESQMREYLGDSWKIENIRKMLTENPELSGVPLFLQMLAELAKYKPHRLATMNSRSQLYGAYLRRVFETEKALDKRRLPSHDELNYEVYIVPSMKQLSYKSLLDGHVGRFPEESILTYEIEPSMLNHILRWNLLKRVVVQNDSYLEYRHHSFQEYYAALELAEVLFDADGRVCTDKLCELVEHTRWDEPLRFLIEILDHDRAARLLSSISSYDMLLACELIDCVPEFLCSREEVRAVYLDWLAKCSNPINILSEGDARYTWMLLFFAIATKNNQDAISRFLSSHERDLESAMVDAALDLLYQIHFSHFGGEHALLYTLFSDHDLELSPELNRIGEALAWMLGIIALGQLGGSKAAKALMKLWRLAKGESRRTISWALSRLRDPDSLEVLLDMMFDADGEVRFYAVNAFRELGINNKVERIVETVRRDKKRLTDEVAIILAESNNASAQALVNELKNDENCRSRALVHFALDWASSVKDRSASLNDDSTGTRREPDEGVESARIRDEELQDLRRMLGDSNWALRWFAASTLGARRDKRTEDDLKAMLEDPEPAVRGEAALSLGRFTSVSSMEEIAKLLDDASDFVRFRAACALARLGDSRSLSYLLQVICQDDVDSALSAFQSLKELFVVRPQLLKSSYETSWKEWYAFYRQHPHLFVQMNLAIGRRFLHVKLVYWTI